MSMNLTLKIWRRAGPTAKGELVTYPVKDISADMSFPEMLDVLNEQLIAEGTEPIAFDSDCREGICGMCGLMISGRAHGPERTTSCQLHMRSFRDGETITVEPWRANAFPIIRDLIVDRSAFDRIIQSGGFVSVNTGAAPEAHSVPVPKEKADRAFDSAKCIGCGACVAACPNASGMLFLGAKVTHWVSCRRVSRSATVASSRCSRRTTSRASAAAPTSVSAPRRAPRRSRST